VCGKKEKGPGVTLSQERRRGLKTKPPVKTTTAERKRRARERTARLDLHRAIHELWRTPGTRVLFTDMNPRTGRPYNDSGEIDYGKYNPELCRSIMRFRSHLFVLDLDSMDDWMLFMRLRRGWIADGRVVDSWQSGPKVGHKGAFVTVRDADDRARIDAEVEKAFGRRSVIRSPEAGATPPGSAYKVVEDTVAKRGPCESPDGIGPFVQGTRYGFAAPVVRRVGDFEPFWEWSVGRRGAVLVEPTSTCRCKGCMPQYFPVYRTADRDRMWAEQNGNISFLKKRLAKLIEADAWRRPDAKADVVVERPVEIEPEPVVDQVVVDEPVVEIEEEDADRFEQMLNTYIAEPRGRASGPTEASTHRFKTIRFGIHRLKMTIDDFIGLSGRPALRGLTGIRQLRKEYDRAASRPMRVRKKLWAEYYQERKDKDAVWDRAGSDKRVNSNMLNILIAFMGSPGMEVHPGDREIQRRTGLPAREVTMWKRALIWLGYLVPVGPIRGPGDKQAQCYRIQLPYEEENVGNTGVVHVPFPSPWGTRKWLCQQLRALAVYGVRPGFQIPFTFKGEKRSVLHVLMNGLSATGVVSLMRDNGLLAKALERDRARAERIQRERQVYKAWLGRKAMASPDPEEFLAFINQQAAKYQRVLQGEMAA
jgi:hypothetical protein